MADIIPNVVVSMPSQLFTLARSFKAASNGKIYVGKIDTDPTIPSNQIPAYIENEDGSLIPASQPIMINAGGYPSYLGQVAKVVTVQGHSMAIYDAFGTQQFYFPNVLKYDPDQFRQELEAAGGVVTHDEYNADGGVVKVDKLANTTDVNEGDAKVGVKQPYAGSSARTQHDKNLDTISVKDFGAVGDGVADDTLALSNAANASYERDTPLLILGGTYLISNSVVFRREIITSGNVNFSAAGVGDVPPTVNIFFARKMDLRNVSFSLLNVFIRPTGEDSVHMPMVIDQCNFVNSSLTVGQNSVITAGYEITSNKFTCQNSRTFNGVTILNANHVKIEENEFQDHNSSILIAPTRSFAAQNISINNNRMSGYVISGIRLIGSSLFRITKLTVKNNTISQGARDIAQVNRGAVIGLYLVDFTFDGNTISNVSDALTLEAVVGMRIINNTFKIVGALNGFRARACSNVKFSNNTFDHGNTTGTYSALIGNSTLATPFTANIPYVSKNWEISNNTFNVASLALKVENTDSVKVYSNSFTCPIAISANGLLFFGAGVTRGAYYDNRFYAPSGTPVRNDSSTGVTSGVSDQTLVVRTVSLPVVNAPIITASDADLNGARSYLCTFSLGDHRQIKQFVDINNKKTLSNWMATVSGATLGFNASAWNQNTNQIGDIVANGLVYDSYGAEAFGIAQSMLVIDEQNKLTCRNYVTSSSASSIPLMIGAASVAEKAWQTAAFRCPLVVDGSVYDPVPTGLLPSAAYSTQRSGRTALGQKADGTYMLLVVDGATDISGTTMANVAAKLVAAGCINAFNLDGGGSSTLWYNGSVINNPSDSGGQREIPSAMYV